MNYYTEQSRGLSAIVAGVLHLLYCTFSLLNFIEILLKFYI